MKVVNSKIHPTKKFPRSSRLFQTEIIDQHCTLFPGFDELHQRRFASMAPVDGKPSQAAGYHHARHLLEQAEATYPVLRPAGGSNSGLPPVDGRLQGKKCGEGGHQHHIIKANAQAPMLYHLCSLLKKTKASTRPLTTQGKDLRGAISTSKWARLGVHPHLQGVGPAARTGRRRAGT